MKELYIERDLTNTLIDTLRHFPAVAVTGPRQSGKSTLIQHSLPDYNYATFDDPIILRAAENDPNMFLDSLGEKIIIDEIQYFPEILRYIKIRIDTDRNTYGRYVLTGSQQFILIKDLGETLAGRIALLELLPFNIPEQRRITAKSTIKSEKLFLNACIKGTFPEVSLNPEISPAWFGSYLKTYLEREARTLYNIGGLSDFQKFIQLLAARCSQVLNMSSLSRDVGISLPTVKKWLSILEAGRIIFLLQPYFSNLGKRITKSPKVYFIDCGVVSYLTGLSDIDHIIKGPLGGALFESYCIQEIIKLYLNAGKQPRIFYLRTNNQLEVDLIIETEFNTVLPLEIKLSKTPRQSMANGITRFMEIFKKIKCIEPTVITLSAPEFSLRRGVNFTEIEIFLNRLNNIINGKKSG